MNAECTRTKLRFQGLDGRDVVGRFDGGEITSDGGGVLLREVEHRTRILGRLSECFTDYRDVDRIEHSVEALIKQRVLGLCLGYEDLNDHDELCRDRLLALLCDRDDLTGEFRRVESDRGKPLAGKSTLNRLELTPVEGPKPEYKKIVADPAGMDELLVEVFLEAEPITQGEKQEKKEYWPKDRFRSPDRSQQAPRVILCQHCPTCFKIPPEVVRHKRKKHVCVGEAGSKSGKRQFPPLGGGITADSREKGRAE